MADADLIIPLVSPRESLQQSIDAYQFSQCLYAAARLGIADLLQDGPRHPAELAYECGADPNALFRLLRALSSAGVFSHLPDGQFEQNQVSESLRTDAPGSLRAWAILAGEQPYPAWGHLLHSIRTGEPAFNQAFGMGAWQYRAQNPAAAMVFDEAMSAYTRAITASILENCDFTRFARIIDVGGGQGALLARILQVNPLARGVLYDLAPVVAAARDALQQAGVGERCETVAGSFLESIPAGGDCYILKDILLDWVDDRAAHILRNCRKAAGEKATLLIIEIMMASDRPGIEAAMADMRMMVMNGGRLRTREEAQALLRKAGFALVEMIPVGFSHQMIAANPA